MNSSTNRLFVFIGVVATVTLAALASRGDRGGASIDTAYDAEINENARRMLHEGRETFRRDTFGSEDFWGGALRLHEAIEGAKNGGVGDGLSPAAALQLGLKVDSDALSPAMIAKIKNGQVDLNDPDVTLLLLQANAVVGVTGFFDGPHSLRSVGIQCAICHSDVDNSVTTGIGKRLDGWANRDLDIGAIVATAPDLSPFAELLGVTEQDVKDVLNSWGPGKFDAELVLDGKAFRDDQKSAATLIPPAFGLAGVNLHTWTGWGGVSHWNAFVANLEMHGKGTFFDPRLDDASKFPIAARERMGHVTSDPDLITPKLAALHFYQLAIPAPVPPEGSFDAEAAARGDMIFSGKAMCATCHVEPIYTEPGWNMHTPEEIGIDDFQAMRSPDERYRTTPLAGLWTHQKGGFYHDGRFATLLDVVDHYDDVLPIDLSERDKLDLVEYLKSIPEPLDGKRRAIAPQSANPASRPAAAKVGARLQAPTPNPMSSSSTIAFHLAAPADVQLSIFDVSGRRVRTLAEGARPSGDQSVTWDGTDMAGQRVASGVYFYRLWIDGAAVGDERIVIR